MSFHSNAIMTPRGSADILVPAGGIPADLWTEFAMAVLLEPEPRLFAEWTRSLEGHLGVTDADRRAAARAAYLPFPGEAPGKRGHALTALDEPEEACRRRSAVRQVDEHLDWYLVRCATRRERRAEEQLSEAGFAVYLPRLKRWNRVGKERRLKEEPLFAGYLFVGLYTAEREGAQSLSHVEGVEAVHAVVRFGRDRYPHPIGFKDTDGSGWSIAGILRAELEGEFDRTRRDARKDPEPGSPVQIVGGSFQGFAATFVKRRDDERIEVLFSLFGRTAPLVLDPTEVGGLSQEDE